MLLQLQWGIVKQIKLFYDVNASHECWGKYILNIILIFIMQKLLRDTVGFLDDKVY